MIKLSNLALANEEEIFSEADKRKQKLDKNEKLEVLPPPNPILNYSGEEEYINTALKVIFKPLPEFSKKVQSKEQNDLSELSTAISNNTINENSDSQSQNPLKLIKQRSKGQGQKIQKMPKSESYSVNQSIGIYVDVEISRNNNVSSLFELKGIQVYRKYDNSRNNYIPSTGERYFASYFVNLNSIINDIAGNSLIKQKALQQAQSLSAGQKKGGEPFDNQKNQNQNQQINVSNIPQFIPSLIFPSNEIPSPIEQSTSSSPFPHNSSLKKPSSKKIQELTFDSNFESGNLFAAYKISEREYDLVLQNDINSKGNTQWFFFQVENSVKGKTATFNILNFCKNSSLFQKGMKPVVFSTKDNDKKGDCWKRDCFEVKYEKTNILREGSSQNYYYSLSFSYTFQFSNDTVYFAHCFPYTYSDSQKFMAQLLNDPLRKPFVFKKLLCLTLAKNKCEMLTITSQHLQQSLPSHLKNQPSFLKRPKELIESKKIVFLTARQHPGETPSSYILEGAVQFLTDPFSSEAAFLREHFIFKVIPMLNPDGVIHGNYRCDLSGVDLNRQWINPSKELHPTVYSTKSAILKNLGERRCSFICDFHGHSKKMNSFFYGNPNEKDPFYSKVIPMECSELNKAIEFKSCTFNLTEDKKTTLRQALENEIQIDDTCLIYTFEASFFGWEKQSQKFHYTVDQLKALGKDILIGFKNSIELDIIEQLSKYQPNNVLSENAENRRKKVLEMIEKRQGQIQENDSGSDSCPSEDELNKKEKQSVQGSLARKMKQKIQDNQLHNIKDTRSYSKDKDNIPIRKIAKKEPITSPSPNFNFIYRNQVRINISLFLWQNLFLKQTVQTDCWIDFGGHTKRMFQDKHSFQQRVNTQGLFSHLEEDKDFIQNINSSSYRNRPRTSNGKVSPNLQGQSEKKAWNNSKNKNSLVGTSLFDQCSHSRCNTSYDHLLNQQNQDKYQINTSQINVKQKESNTEVDDELFLIENKKSIIINDQNYFSKNKSSTYDTISFQKIQGSNNKSFCIQPLETNIQMSTTSPNIKYSLQKDYTHHHHKNSSISINNQSAIEESRRKIDLEDDQEKKSIDLASKKGKEDNEEKEKYFMSQKKRNQSELNRTYEQWLNQLRRSRIKILDRNKLLQPIANETSTNGFRVSSYGYQQQVRMEVVANLRQIFRSCSPTMIISGMKVQSNNNNNNTTNYNTNNDCSANNQGNEQLLTDSFIIKGKLKRNSQTQTDISITPNIKSQILSPFPKKNIFSISPSQMSQHQQYQLQQQQQSQQKKHSKSMTQPKKQELEQEMQKQRQSMILDKEKSTLTSSVLPPFQLSNNNNNLSLNQENQNFGSQTPQYLKSEAIKSSYLLEVQSNQDRINMSSSPIKKVYANKKQNYLLSFSPKKRLLCLKTTADVNSEKELDTKQKHKQLSILTSKVKQRPQKACCLLFSNSNEVQDASQLINQISQQQERRKTSQSPPNMSNDLERSHEKCISLPPKKVTSKKLKGLAIKREDTRQSCDEIDLKLMKNIVLS